MGQSLSYFLPEAIFPTSSPAASEKKPEPETPGVTMIAEDPRSPLTENAPFGRTPIQLKIHNRRRFMQDTPTGTGGSFLEIAHEDTPKSAIL